MSLPGISKKLLLLPLVAGLVGLLIQSCVAPHPGYLLPPLVWNSPTEMHPENTTKPPKDVFTEALAQYQAAAFDTKFYTRGASGFHCETIQFGVASQPCSAVGINSIHVAQRVTFGSETDQNGFLKVTGLPTPTPTP
jgi:hypothetical protein